MDCFTPKEQDGTVYTPIEHDCTCVVRQENVSCPSCYFMGRMIGSVQKTIRSLAHGTVKQV